MRPLISVIMRNPVKEGDERKQIAVFVSNTVDAGMNRGFVPYMPNERNDFWTVDTGNDWKLQFDEKDPRKFRVWHRYNNIEAERAICGWLAFRLGGQVVEEYYEDPENRLWNLSLDLCVRASGVPEAMRVVGLQLLDKSKWPADTMAGGAIEQVRQTRCRCIEADGKRIPQVHIEYPGIGN
jgi:hypothetical protein